MSYSNKCNRQYDETYNNECFCCKHSDPDVQKHKIINCYYMRDGVKCQMYLCSDCCSIGHICNYCHCVFFKKNYRCCVSYGSMCDECHEHYQGFDGSDGF